MDNKTPHLLFIDDDPNMCELISATALSWGYKVTSKTSPLDALEAASRESYDIAVTDLRMPGMNGISLCEKLGQAAPSMPVLVLTSFGSFDSAVSALRVGATDFLSKPIEMNDLRSAIDRSLANKGKRPAWQTSEEGAGEPVSFNVDTADTLIPMDEIEKRYIFHVLKCVGGCKAHASRLLGLDRKTLYRKLDQYANKN